MTVLKPVARLRACHGGVPVRPGSVYVRLRQWDRFFSKFFGFFPVSMVSPVLIPVLKPLLSKGKKTGKALNVQKSNGLSDIG